MSATYDHEKAEAKKEKIAAYDKELLTLMRGLYDQVQLQLSNRIDFPTVNYSDHSDLKLRCASVLDWADRVSDFIRENENPHVPVDYIKRVEECTAAPKSITLEFPIPNTVLSPNSKPGTVGQIYKKRQAVKKARLGTRYDTIRQVRLSGMPDNLKWKHVRADVQWFHKTWQRPDSDNASAMLKSMWDGIQDSRLILDDKYLTPMPPVFSEDDANPRLIITLTEE